MACLPVFSYCSGFFSRRCWVLAVLAAPALWAGCATVGSHYRHAQALEAEARWDEAIAAYYQAAEEQPQRAAIYLGLAGALERKGMTAETAQALDKAFQTAGQEPEVAARLADAYFRSGQTYQAEGKVTDAYEAWQKALKLNPQHPGAATQLAKLYSERGEDDKAAAQYQQLTQNRPQDTEARRARRALGGLSQYMIEGAPRINPRWRSGARVGAAAVLPWPQPSRPRTGRGPRSG